MCVCVCEFLNVACVYLFGFIMCGCFVKICTFIYCVFVLFRLSILFVLSVLVEGILLQIENCMSVSNNNIMPPQFHHLTW